MHDPLIAEHCGLLAQAAGNGRRPGGPAPRHPRRLDGARRPGRRPARGRRWRWTRRSSRAGRAASGRSRPRDFFVDYLTTALEPGEILTGIRVPKLGGDWGYRYEKFHRTAQAWAIVGVAALARRSNGHVAEARVGLTNMGPVPVRATAVEAAAAGAQASSEALRAAAASADEGTQPPADLHGAPDYRRHLARVLTGRALAAAAGV